MGVSDAAALPARGVKGACDVEFTAVIFQSGIIGRAGEMEFAEVLKAAEVAFSGLGILVFVGPARVFVAGPEGIHGELDH